MVVVASSLGQAECIAAVVSAVPVQFLTCSVEGIHLYPFYLVVREHFGVQFHLDAARV